MLQGLVVGGYIVSALLYASVLVNPTGGLRSGLLSWVRMEGIGLAEFLSVHAATLMGAIVLVKADGGSGEQFGAIFWVLAAFYGLLAVGAWAFHRSHRALFGFYILLAVRGVQFFSLGKPEVDVMRAEVVKNFAMSVPMMLLVAGVVMSDDGVKPWQDRFLRDGTSLWQRVKRGRALLFVSAYYALWAFVEYRWPERLTVDGH